MKVEQTWVAGREVVYIVGECWGMPGAEGTCSMVYVDVCMDVLCIRGVTVATVEPVCMGLGSMSVLHIMVANNTTRTV